MKLPVYARKGLNPSDACNLLIIYLETHTYNHGKKIVAGELVEKFKTATVTNIKLVKSIYVPVIDQEIIEIVPVN